MVCGVRASRTIRTSRPGAIRLGRLSQFGVAAFLALSGTGAGKGVGRYQAGGRQGDSGRSALLQARVPVGQERDDAEALERRPRRRIYHLNNFMKFDAANECLSADDTSLQSSLQVISILGPVESLSK